MALEPVGRPVVPVSRAVFQAQKAECLICGAYVTPAGAMTQMLVRRRFGPDAAAGQCTICELFTYFDLR